MMTKNTMNDLNDHLFLALERLNDENLSGEDLQQEIERSKAISEVGKTVIDNAKTVLSAMKFNDEKLDANMQLPKMLGGGS